MIDLSFLTEEEQEAIMKVLQRDAALKRAEEERVRHLPEKVKDDQQLKNMSGQWFYEAKAKRHRDKIHGADIIRASMRKKKPQAAAEQSKHRAQGAKESWVNNVNKDAFLPPELAGVTEEPEEDAVPVNPSSSVVNPASIVTDMSQEHTRKSTASPAKQRKNPFNNSKLPEDDLSQQAKNEQSKNGRDDLFQTSKEGELSASEEKSSVMDISSQILQKPKHTVQGPVNGSQTKAPIPKARKMIYKSNNLKQDDNQSFPRLTTDSLNGRGVPRGILKRNSSSSSTDSETVRFNQNFEPKSKVVSPGLTIHERISEKEHSLSDDSSQNMLEPLKHVRFSAVKDELPQNSGLIHGREVGEFGVLESDRLKNAAEDAEDTDVLQNEPEPSQYRTPLPFNQPASSPGASKNETQQPTTSHSFPISGPSSHSEVLTPRPQSFETSSTVNEYKAKSSELSRLESELYKSPADELSHCVDPVPSQVPDQSSRDHQQGKPPFLTAVKAKTSSRSGPHTTEIMKTTDDSISKVLDWFNRSSHSDDRPSLKHPRGKEPKEKTDLKSQIAIALVTDDTSPKENGSKALSPTQVELKPVRSDSTFLVEGDLLPSGNYQDNGVNFKLKSMNLSPQGTMKEGLGILQSFENYDDAGQRSENKDCSQDSKNTGEGTGIYLPISNYSYSALKGSDTEDQVPCNIKDVVILSEEESKLCVHQKHRGNLEVNFYSSAIVKEPSLKDNMKAERKSKGGDTYILKASLEAENIELLSGAANNRSPWKMPDVGPQQESNELSKNEVQRERYKRVSDRISFWEGEKAAAKLTYKEPTSSCSQGPSAKAYQPVKSLGMHTNNSSIGQNDYNQVTAKQVILDEDNQASHHLSFHSSNKPKETRLPKSGAPSINEPIKKLPVEDSLHSGRDISLLAFQHPLNGDNEIQSPLEKDSSLIGESKPHFKVLTLKERMDETNTEQVYNHSQFENLRKFWDLEAKSNSEANVEKKSITTNYKHSMPFNSHKHKESNDIKSSGKHMHEVEAPLSHKKTPARKEMEKLNSKSIPQVLPDETTLLWRPPRTSIHQLPGNESSKENMEKNTEWSVTPVIKKEKDYSDQEIEESIVKTSVFSRDYKDTFNDSLQKLLAEASSPAIQPFGGKVLVKQDLERGFSENRMWPQKTDLADAEEEAEQPKEIVNEHVDRTVAPPKVECNTFIASLNKLLKEASEISPSPLPTNLEPVTAGTHSEPEESRIFEKVMDGSHNTSDERERIASFPKEEETLGNAAVPQKVQSGECQLNTENLVQMAVGVSHHLHRKDSFSDEATSPQHLSFSWDAHHDFQDKALPSQREISETVEKVILPPKTALHDTNAALQKLLREAQLSHLTGREVISGEVNAEFPEGIQAADSPQISQGIMAPGATIKVPDRKDFYSFNLVPDKTYEIGSYVVSTDRVVQIPPSEQSFISSGSTVVLYSKELPQEGAETVRETIIHPKSQHLKFSSGLEKLLEEIIENFPAKYESSTGTLSVSQSIGSTEEPRQAASEFHLEEIKETVEKSEVPSITESAFDTSLEKLLKEIPEVSYQLQMSVKEETPEESSLLEKTKFLGTVSHFYWTASEASEMKVKSNVLKCQVNQCDKELGGDKTVTGVLVDLCGPESGIESSGIPQLCVDHEIGTIKTMYSSEDRECEIAGREGNFQERDFQEAPERNNLSRYRQPISLLMNQENPTEASKIELFLASPYKRKEKEEEKVFFDSDFSDGNISSNAESGRYTSEHFRLNHLTANQKAGGSNPPATPRKEDWAIYFHGDTTLETQRGVAMSRNRLDGSSEEEPSPVFKTMERSAARKMPCKSLEDISSDSSNQAKVDNLPEELVRSAEDDQKADQEPETNECIPGISTVPSQPGNQFSHPDKLKRMSKSVPAFLQDESDDRETDTASESSYQLSRHKKSPSSLTNLSSSSGMTSLSSVSGSVMSVYSGDFGNLEVKGNIQFAIDYVDSLKELHVFVAQCKDLAAADVKKQRSDPYVKTYLLPDKGKMGKKKTFVVKKTLNPVYNEILRYKIEKQSLKTQKLNVSVWHRDTFKRNSFLGEVELDLETWDWNNKQNKQLKWYPLKRKTAPVALEAENRGEMKLALQYVPEPSPGKKLPTTGEVHIWVKECLDLPLLRGSHLNSFVKCTILPDTSRKSRQKTRAVGKTTNPVFNHTMVYDGFRPEDLTEACVELTVWDHYKLTNQFLGGLRIGFGTGKSYGTEVDWMDSTSEEVALWEKMVDSPNTWIEATLPLRMLLIAKISK